MLSGVFKSLLRAAREAQPPTPRPRAPDVPTPRAPDLPSPAQGADTPPVGSAMPPIDPMQPPGQMIPGVADPLRGLDAPGGIGGSQGMPPRPPGTGDVRQVPIEPVRGDMGPLAPGDAGPRPARGAIIGDAMRQGTDNIPATDRFGPAPTARGIDELGQTPADDGAAFNWGKFDTTDDVKLVIKDIYERGRNSPAYSRGYVSFDEIDDAVAARMLDTSPSKILEMRTASAEDIQEAFAVQTMLAEDLKRVAERAMDPARGTDQDLLDMRLIQEQLAVVTTHIKGLQTETARALASMRMMRGARNGSVDLLNDVMQRLGGRDFNLELAGIIDTMDPENAAAMAIRARRATRFDMLMEAYINTLLTNPFTHQVNFMTSAMNVGWRNFDWTVAYGINQIRRMLTGGEAERIYAREIINLWVDVGSYRAIFANLHTGDAGAATRSIGQIPFVRGIRNGIRAWISGEPGDLVSRFDTGFRPQITAANVGALPEFQAAGRILERLGFGDDARGMLGAGFDLAADWVVRQPGRLMMGADEVVKTWAYMNEMRRIATHQGIENGHHGEALRRFIQDALADPDTHIPGAPEQAWRAAQDATFQTPLRRGSVAQRLQQIIFGRSTLGAHAQDDQNLGALARGAFAAGDALTDVPRMYVRWHFPFWKTPWNLFYWSLDHTPLAPMRREFWGAIRQGGPEADLAFARVITGTGFMYGMYEYVLQGLITGGGPTDPKMRRRMEETGWRPYTILIRKDSWVGEALGLKKDKRLSYKRLDPFSMLIGAIADYHDVIGYMTEDEREESSTMLLGLVLSISRNMLSKTWLTGASRLFSGLEELLSERNRGALYRQLSQAPMGMLAPPGLTFLLAVLDPEGFRHSSRSASAARMNTLGKLKDPDVLSRYDPLDIVASPEIVEMAAQARLDYERAMQDANTSAISQYFDDVIARVRARLRSGEQPPILDYWGKEVRYDQGAFYGLTPLAVTDSEFDHKALEELGLDQNGKWVSTRVNKWPTEKYLKFIRAVGITGELIRLGKQLPEWSDKINKVQLTPWEHHRLIKITNSWRPGDTGVLTFEVAPYGEVEAKIFEFQGLNLKEAMTRLIKTDFYQRAPDLEGMSAVMSDGVKTLSKYEMLARLASFYRRGVRHKFEDGLKQDTRVRLEKEEGLRLGGAEFLFLKPDGVNTDPKAEDWYTRWRAWQNELRRRAEEN